MIARCRAASACTRFFDECADASSRLPDLVSRMAIHWPCLARERRDNSGHGFSRRRHSVRTPWTGVGSTGMFDDNKRPYNASRILAVVHLDADIRSGLIVGVTDPA